MTVNSNPELDSKLNLCDFKDSVHTPFVTLNDTLSELGGWVFFKQVEQNRKQTFILFDQFKKRIWTLILLRLFYFLSKFNKCYIAPDNLLQ